jgi:ABC-type amino acid transport substrate-binding protein
MKPSLLLAALLLGVASLLPSVRAQSETVQQIKQHGQIRLGMYLGFEGLSFTQRGENVGLEVELSKLLAAELSREFGQPIKAEIVNQEWAQIVQELRSRKYDAVFSALIPSTLYKDANIAYTRSYLDTGPVICTEEKDGAPAKDVTADVASLAGKRVVVINDPAVRRVLRHRGVYVPADEGKTDLERSFPKAATEAELARIGKTAELIAVQEIIQLDEMPAIYQAISRGEVDAGVIDLGIIWWVATESPRWAPRIHAFTQPIGPYIYSAATRAEDTDLRDALDAAIGRMRASPEYATLLKRWHGAQIEWGLSPDDFLK